MILQPEDVFLRGFVLSPLVLRMIAFYQRNGAFTTPKGLNQKFSVVLLS